MHHAAWVLGDSDQKAMTPTSAFRNVALVFAGLLVAWLLFVLFYDVGPVDDSDLALPDREVDPAQNPYPKIQELDFSEEDREELSRVSAMMAGSEPMDTAFLLSMLEKHAAHLEAFDRCATMTDWKRDISVSDSSMYALHRSGISTLKRVQVAHFAAIPQREETIGSVVSLLKFAAGLQSGGNRQADWIIGCRIRLEGQKALIGLMDRTFLEADELKRLSEILEDPHLRGLHFDIMIRAEYAYNTQLFSILGTGPSPNRWIPKRTVYKENRTIGSLAKAHRKAIRLAGETSMAAELHPRTNAISQWLRDLPHRLGGNWWGYSVMVGTEDSLSSAVRRFFIFLAQDELLRTRMALERYRIEHGDWPDGLADLVPGYLGEAPLDPMDGNPLRYDRSKRVLYSIGEDLIDSGGLAPDRRGTFRSRAEIVIELEPVNPEPWPEF